MPKSVSRLDTSRDRQTPIYTLVYLSHLSGPWALKVLQVINNLGRKGLT